MIKYSHLFSTISIICAVGGYWLVGGCNLTNELFCHGPGPPAMYLSFSPSETDIFNNEGQVERMAVASENTFIIFNDLDLTFTVK